MECIVVAGINIQAAGFSGEFRFFLETDNSLIQTARQKGGVEQCGK